MQDGQYLFHTRTQLFRQKQDRNQQTQNCGFSDFSKSERKFRFSNQHYEYRHKNKKEDLNLKTLRDSIYRPKEQESPTIKTIINDWKQVTKDKRLISGIKKLKNQELLSLPNINIQEISKKSRVKFTYNDYHQKQTNPGYSRNCLGYYFTR